MRWRELEKRISTASNLIALISSRSFQKMLANFSGVEFWKTVSKFSKTKSHCLAFTSSTKREIRQFDVIVMQWRQRNVQKKNDAYERLFFWQSKGLFTWKWGAPGRWGNPLRWGKKKIILLYMQPYNPAIAGVRSRDYWLVVKHVNKKKYWKTTCFGD